MADSTNQRIILHFMDGSFQIGTLQSSLLNRKTIQYTPQTFSGRRRVPRVPFIKEVKIDDHIIQRATDLSAQGMYVETLTNYPVGTTLPVSIQFGDETVQLTASVSFIDPGIGMGLEFQRLPSSVFLKLGASVQQALKDSGDCSQQDQWGKGDRGFQRGDGRIELKNIAEWETQRQDRRKNKRGAVPKQIEVDFSDIKSIFLLDWESFSASCKRPLSDSCNEAIVEFRDGERIQGTLHALSPDEVGFFVDLPVGKLIFTVFINKSAVKSVEHL